MVRKQNERTLILQYRIITLSLPTKTLFLILASRPLSTRLGAFSSPKHFPANFFRNFFQSDQGDFFLYFWCEKLWGLKALGAPQMGGGCPFSYALHTAKVAPFHPTATSPFPAFLGTNFQTIGAKSGKSEFFLARFGVFSGKSETRRGKILIYF